MKGGAVAGSVVGVLMLLLVVLTIIVLVMFAVRKYDTACVGTIIQLLLNQISIT